MRKRSLTVCSFLTLAVKAKEILGRSWESEKIRYWWDCFKASPKKSGWHRMLQWKPDKHQALKKASDTRGWSVTCFFAPQRVSSHTSRAQSALGASHAMLHKLPSFARAPSHAQGDTCTCRWQEDVNTSCPRWPQGTASYTAGLLFLVQPPPWHRQVLPSSKVDSNCSRRYGKCLGLCCKSNHFAKKSTSCCE